MPRHQRDICTGCGTCCECVEDPRGSVMPPNVAPIDPLFIHAVFNEFEPDEWALLEKGVKG